MNKLTDPEKHQIMSQTVKPIVDLLTKRLTNRVEVLNTLAAGNLDTVPESVKVKREEEASKIRAVMQEQKDLIEIIKALYPDVQD